MSLSALKALAKERGITEPNGNKGHKATWINALQSGAASPAPAFAPGAAPAPAQLTSSQCFYGSSN